MLLVRAFLGCMPGWEDEASAVVLSQEGCGRGERTLPVKRDGWGCWRLGCTVSLVTCSQGPEERLGPADGQRELQGLLPFMVHGKDICLS